MKNSALDIIKGSVLTLVTDQFNCERIILASKELAESIDKQLYVLNISTPKTNGCDRDHSALEHLFRVSKENDAVMLVQYSEHPSREITKYIENMEPSAVITGIPSTQNSVLHKLWIRFPTTSFYLTDADGLLNKVSVMDRIIG